MLAHVLPAPQDTYYALNARFENDNNKNKVNLLI